MSMSTESMYQQIILDHYKHPHHRGLPEDFDAEVHHVQPHLWRRGDPAGAGARR